MNFFRILASTVTRCISNSAFAFLLGIPIEIASSAIGLKICAIPALIKKYESITKKKKKKYEKVVLSAKVKLNSIEVLISKALINLVISHEDFILINLALKKYNEMKEEIKSLKTYINISLKILVYL